MEQKKPPVLKLKAVPERVLEYGGEDSQTKANYLAGWMDGTEAQLNADVSYYEEKIKELDMELVMSMLKMEQVALIQQATAVTPALGKLPGLKYNVYGG